MQLDFGSIPSTTCGPLTIPGVQNQEEALGTSTCGHPSPKVPKWRNCTVKRPRVGVCGGSLFLSLCSGNLLNEVEGDDSKVYSIKWKRKTSVAFTSSLQPLVLLCLYLCPCLYLSLCLSVSVSVSISSSLAWQS